MWMWCVDLREIASYWRSWYEGLFKCFFVVKVLKLFLFVGNDCLDIELMIV